MTALKEIELSTPIINGTNEITKFSMRKPLAGDLRGIKLLNFIDADVDSLAKVLPRITIPALAEQDVYKMDITDLANVVLEISDFLKPKSANVAEASLTE